jgi:hypothetical protein
MLDTLKCVEYLRSYEADGDFSIVDVDLGVGVVSVVDISYDQYVIVGCYIEKMFGVSLTAEQL